MKYRTFIVKFNYSMPMQLNRDEVMYIEKEHSDVLDGKMRSLSGKENFIYMPQMVEELRNDSEVMDFYNPTHRDIMDVNPYDLVLNYVKDSEEEIRYGLMVNICLGVYGGYYHLFCNLDEEFEVSEFESVCEEMKRRANAIYEKNKHLVEGIRYSVRREDDPFPNEVDEETEKIVDEMREMMCRLEQKGIKRELIMQMLGNKRYSVNPRDLSRMIIDARYRIFLRDYDNLEIKMTPLVKSVYIFFLKHPKGVFLKNMSDHYGELLSIYSHITAFSDNREVKKSIKRLCDPTDNSINEKCSRIRQVFVSMFEKNIAEQYIVTGERNEARKIAVATKSVEFLKRTISHRI